MPKRLADSMMFMKLPGFWTCIPATASSSGGYRVTQELRALKMQALPGTGLLGTLLGPLQGASVLQLLRS